MSDDKGWPRQDFEERIQPAIEQIMSQRAWMMNGYAQIEFLLADLIVKCRRFNDYAELNKLPLPFGIDNRVDRVRQMLAVGPLNQFAEETLPLLEGFLALENVRHFFTHGFVQVHITRDGKEFGLFSDVTLSQKREMAEKRDM